MAIFRKRPDRIRGVAGSLTGKSILVVDGTVGAGPGVVKVAAEAGGQVVVAGPDTVAIDLQLRTLANTPVAVTGIPAPTTTDEQRRQLLASIEQPFDVVVVNPSEMTLPSPTSIDSPATEQTPGLTPHDAVALAHLAAAALQDRGRVGSIVFITAIAQAGPSGSAAAFLRSEMEELARRVAPNGIRVNAVAPGHVAVNRRDHVLSSRAAPLGHVSLHPVEIGKGVWFLVNNDLSAGVTGTTLIIDRGASLTRPEW